MTDHLKEAHDSIERITVAALDARKLVLSLRAELAEAKACALELREAGAQVNLSMEQQRLLGAKWKNSKVDDERADRLGRAIDRLDALTGVSAARVAGKGGGK